MNDDRSKILASIRASLATAAGVRAARGPHGSPPAIAAPPPTTELTVPAVGPKGPASIRAVTGFQGALDRVQGVCHRVTSDAGAADALQAVIADLGVRRVVRSDDHLVIEILERVIGGFELLPPDADRSLLLQCELGVSRATIGVVEYGTIVLSSGDTQGVKGTPTERQRLVALLPATHVAILAATDLVETWDAALTALCSTSGDLPPTATFATGPSRTADIELELVLGVHGPKNQHVILLEHR
ncbi:MAG: LUD domain-containing protein [Planctomycetota bacterium]|jgi:L-lactate dehydrogenase complex protein LldG|nr:LUD domain-containing protein [Planctomycetota bacterium]MDA1025179.1 LUD domain-containing protein [Planctomycetota bacterium]